MSNNPNDNGLVLSTIGLRKLIGWLGVALPLLCLFRSMAAQVAVGGSISAYYHTRVHGLFAGILCGLGVCLYSYKGYTKLESYLASFGGVCAVGVATCPTGIPKRWNGVDPDLAKIAVDLYIGPKAPAIAIVHVASALLLFTIFMIFAGAFFPRDQASDQKDPLTVKSMLMALLNTLVLFRENPKAEKSVQTPKKQRRNVIYRVCARLIGFSILMIAIQALLDWAGILGEDFFPQWVFLWETVAIWAFAVSWLTKAESFSVVAD